MIKHASSQTVRAGLAESNRIEGPRFGLLGAFQASYGEEPIRIPAGRHRTLLALLAINLNQPVPVERIIRELWPTESSKFARKTVQGYVWRLRASFEGCVETRGACYELVGDPEHAVDGRRFAELARAGRDAMAGGELGAAEELLVSALSIWRGPVLADVPPTPALAAYALHMEELRLTATENLIEVRLRSGRHLDVIPCLRDLVRDHPLHEALRAQLMLALCQAGRQAEALAVFRELRARSVSDLGLEPGQAVQRLHQRILAADPSLGLDLMRG